MIDKIQVMNRARLKKRAIRDNLVKKEAARLFEKYKDNPLFLSGVVLYWAEGTRPSKNYRKYQLAFTNSDPKLAGFYCKFLDQYFNNFDKRDWRAGLYLYPDIDQDWARTYWSKIIGIEEGQFIKPQILRGKDWNTNKLRYGICCVYISSKDACLTMETWIKAIGDMRR